MKALFKSKWKAKKFVIKAKIYLLRNKTHELFDKIFDEIYYLGYHKFTIVHTLFSFCIFIISMTHIASMRRDRVVVDIQSLTK